VLLIARCFLCFYFVFFLLCVCQFCLHCLLTDSIYKCIIPLYNIMSFQHSEDDADRKFATQSGTAASTTPPGIPIPGAHDHANTTTETVATTNSTSTTAGSNVEELQYARSTLERVGSTASSLSSSLKNKSRVLKMGIETVQRLVSPASAYAWTQYGDPLVSAVDRKIHQTYSAIENAARQRDMRGKHAREMERENRENAGFWLRMKHHLAKSKWYATVNSILTNSSMVQNVYRPADFFCTTLTEVFMTDGDTMANFLSALEQRMGTAWDPRLSSSAKVFFHTSHAVKKMHGAGRFFGGVLQLGRNQVEQTIDGIRTRWDRVIDATDNTIDTWLPDIDATGVALAPDGEEHKTNDQLEDDFGVAGLTDSTVDFEEDDDDDFEDDDDDYVDEDQADEEDDDEDAEYDDIEVNQQMLNDVDSQMKTPAVGGMSSYAADADLQFELERDNLNLSSSSSSALDESHCFSPAYVPSVQVSQPENAPLEDVSYRYPQSMAAGVNLDQQQQQQQQQQVSQTPHRSLGPLSTKLTARLRQRLPLVGELPSHVQGKLAASAWFVHVNEILQQNHMVQYMQAQASAAYAHVVDPAEHFYNTAVRILRAQVESTEDFLQRMRYAMGGAWDERLSKYALSFFRSASADSNNSTRESSPSQPDTTMTE
jgi:hypothetical protein